MLCSCSIGLGFVFLSREQLVLLPISYPFPALAQLNFLVAFLPNSFPCPFDGAVRPSVGQDSRPSHRVVVALQR